MPVASSFGLSLLYMEQPTHPGQPIKQITEAEFICPTEQGVDFKKIEEIPLRRQEIFTLEQPSMRGHIHKSVVVCA